MNVPMLITLVHIDGQLWQLLSQLYFLRSGNVIPFVSKPQRKPGAAKATRVRDGITGTIRK